MAKQTINIGEEANDGTGDALRVAFDKINDNFTELYDDDSTNDVNSVTAGTGLTGTGTTGTITINAIGGDGITANADELEVTVDDSTIELSATDGSGAIQVKDDGITTAKIAADAINGSKIADDSINSEHYVDASIDTAHIGDDQITNAKIADDAVDHDQLASRYTSKQDISTTSGTINLDSSSYAIFELTGTLGTVTLNIQNLKKGQVIDILLTGTLTSAVITLSDDFTTSQINKVGTASLDTTKKNILQVLCADDTDSDAILNYAIATYEADTNPD